MPPLLAQQRNPAMSPHTKGKVQAPITLENISGEKRKKLQQQQQQSLGRGAGLGGGGVKMAERSSWAEKMSTKEN